MPFDFIRVEVERELGAPLEEVFAEFSCVPAATASIAQVHFAVLRQSGAEVAVKVQLGNERAIMHDVRAMHATSVALKWLGLDGGIDSPVICQAYRTSPRLRDVGAGEAMRGAARTTP